MSGMTKEDAMRIQTTQAKGEKDMGSGSFAARAQAAGDKANNAQVTGSAGLTGSTGSGKNNSGATTPNKQ